MDTSVVKKISTFVGVVLVVPLSLALVCVFVIMHTVYSVVGVVGPW